MRISRIMPEKLRAFLVDDRGVATADWVVLTATLAIGTVAIIITIGGGAGDVSSAYRAPLAPVEFPEEE